MTEETSKAQVEMQNAKPNRKYWLAGGVAVLAVVPGAFWFANAAEPEWSTNQSARVVDSPAEPVRVAEANAPEPVAALEARGVVAAANESTIASRVTARISAMPFEEGRSFRRGALLAKFDCSTIRAELTAARAATTAYRKTYETNVELDTYEAVGKNEVQVSHANLGRAQAEANAIAAQLNDCAVYAPFSGTVVEAVANPGEVAASGQPLMRIQSGGQLEAELIVPSNWLTWLKPGATFHFLIDETGATITGTAKRLGASVDPVSKTIRVTADIDPGDAMVLPGMSGTATFAQPDGKPRTAKLAPAEKPESEA
ncbi:efflux RND transporter periplasmic adaptor subunit [Erythrobacter litoralis]|uniref:efflux RND transporter periplasmic adaptor subunit n=1 Tax=Erythrobacter litoralis TaxID=39960 RepID=UPI002434F5F0|nr:efflux RND transporter periplasmic adaptor subunit [Erythrobacter litoralis]MDG6077730.1 efflux RND transporter periplasmic adaptor subunit [Erythrobacter litoralis]